MPYQECFSWYVHFVTNCSKSGNISHIALCCVTSRHLLLFLHLSTNANLAKRQITPCFNLVVLVINWGLYRDPMT